MKKILTLLLLLAGLAGCNGRSDAGIPSPQEAARLDSAALKVALMPTLDCLPFYYAEATGIYDELGLDVRLHTYTAQLDCDTALARKRVEVGYTDLIRAILLQKEGTPLYVIMKCHGGQQLITARSKRIKNISQLKDRMVGIARHSVTDFYSDLIMDSARMEKEAIYRPQVNDIQLRTAMLCNGTLDAVFLPEPYATQARIEGNRRIFGHSIADRPQLMALAITAEAHRDPRRIRQTRLLLEGYNRAVDALNPNRSSESLRTVLGTIYRLPAQATDSLQLPRFEPAAPQHDDNVRAAVTWLRSRNLLPENHPTDSLISTQFIRK